MGRRSRQRARAHGAAPPERLTAPTATYTDADGNRLELRGSLSAATRGRYAETLTGGLHREDAWQRAIELLFEHLAVRWTIAGIVTERQNELIARYRAANAEERRFVRDSLREHVADHFPDVEAP